MAKIKRRRFLLFMGQLGAGGFLVSSTNCSNYKSPAKKMLDLKKELTQLIRIGKEISLKWNCGGDEAILEILMDGKRMDFDDPLVRQLDMYVINYLNLPDVGEFNLEGGGKLVEENGDIYLEYESIMVGYMDYGKEGEKYEWKEVNEKDETYSGKKVLFKGK